MTASAPGRDASHSPPAGRSVRQQRLFTASAWTLFGVFAVWFAARLIPNLALRLRFEDQLIVLRYARNLAEGNGLVYNAGERVMGFTTPLFTMLSSVFVVLGGGQAAAWQNGFGLLCMLGTAALAARLLVRLGAGPAAPLAVALITFNPAVTYNYLYVGMEIHLFALLFLLALDLHLSDRAFAASVTSALLFLTRPEGALLAAMLLTHGWLRERKPPVRQAVAALATALPWLLFALAYYGSVLPRTLGAKEGESIASAWRYLGLVREAYAEAGKSLLAAYSPSLTHSIAGPLLLLGLLFVGATALLRRRADLWPLIAFPLGALLGYAAIGSLPGYTWHYYTLNVLGAFLLTLGVHASLAGVGQLCRRTVKRLPAAVGVVFRRPLASTLLALIPLLALTLPVVRDTSRQIAYRAEPTDRQQGLENIGEWLAERYHPSTSVLVREIGHIGWVSGLRIVDRGGLVTPGLRYDVPRRVATEKFLPDLLLLRADNYGVRDPREGAGFPANLGYERVDGFEHGQEWSLHSLVEPGSPSPREGGEYRYEVARSAAGHLEAVLRYRLVEGEAAPPSRIPIVPPPTGFDGALDAVLPRPGPQPIEGAADFVVSGFIRDEPPDPRGVEAVLLFIGGEMTVHEPGVHRRPDLAALHGLPFANGGFAFRAPADRHLVEREGVLAYAVSRRAVASRLRFSYLPLELEPGNLEILPTTDGRRLVVQPPGDGYHGEVDLLASENRVGIEGWAVDATRGERPRQIVVYRDGHFLVNLGLNRERPEVAERFGNPALQRAGFGGAVPGEVTAASFGERYRVFAIMLRGAAVELSPGPPGYQGLARPNVVHASSAPEPSHSSSPAPRSSHSARAGQPRPQQRLVLQAPLPEGAGVRSQRAAMLTPSESAGREDADREANSECTDVRCEAVFRVQAGGSHARSVPCFLPAGCRGPHDPRREQPAHTGTDGFPAALRSRQSLPDQRRGPVVRQEPLALDPRRVPRRSSLRSQRLSARLQEPGEENREAMRSSAKLIAAAAARIDSGSLTVMRADLRAIRPKEIVMRQTAPVLSAIAVLSLALLACSSGGGGDDVGGDGTAAGTAHAPNPLRDAYFGDLHVHTRFSFDAYLFQTRTNPDDAYRFAKGEAIDHPSGHQLQLQSGALDFQAVTDHGMYLGVMPDMDNPESALYDTVLGADLRQPAPVGGFGRAIQGLRSGEFAELPVDAVDHAARTAWQAIIDAAEAHNDPGNFTTFIGYEYTTSSDDRGNLHRNVIFKGSNVPPKPFATTDSRNPEDLWRWLDGLRDEGIEGLAIPHNSNGSNGHMFMLETVGGEPLDAAYADLRMRNEPLVEMTQVKGTSETHPLLSPNDEWAEFEIFPYRIATTLYSEPKGSYVREAYVNGLVLQETQGFNPFRFGMIGATDTHNSGGTPEEDNFHGKVGVGDGDGQRRGAVPLDEPTEDGEPYIQNSFKYWGGAGLAGVWAEENTRDSIYAAFRRKETFATSGPRMRVRFFAGYHYTDDLTSDPEMIAAAYDGGVPMGGDLLADEGRNPRFLVWAARDADSAPLQRLQMVKGWVEDGEPRESVIDIACADGAIPSGDPLRCPDNGAGVDLSNCSYSRDLGAAELSALWTDPDFDAAKHAVYYVRVLENPTCRWSTWDAIRAGVEPNPDMPSTIQERAWSSPIWYVPSH